MKYLLLLALALAVCVLAPGRHGRAAGACARRHAPAPLPVVRKPSWAAGRPKTVRPVRPAGLR